MSICTYFCWSWQTWLDISVELLSVSMICVGLKKRNSGLFLDQGGIQQYTGSCTIYDICSCIMLYFY